MNFGIFRQFSYWHEKRRLQRKLTLLQQQKQNIIEKLGQTRQREIANSRQSDRKFRENSARAVCARTKKADKAQIRTLDSIIALTQKKLNQLRK